MGYSLKTTRATLWFRFLHQLRPICPSFSHQGPCLGYIAPAMRVHRAAQTHQMRTCQLNLSKVETSRNLSGSRLSQASTIRKIFLKQVAGHEKEKVDQRICWPSGEEGIRLRRGSLHYVLLSQRYPKFVGHPRGHEFNLGFTYPSTKLI